MSEQRTQDRAQALLELGAGAIDRAKREADAWQRARDLAGPTTANWAFAANTARTESMRAVHGWLRDRKTPTLVLSGPNGRGKTIAAARWLGRVGGVWMRADDLGREGWDGGELADRAMWASSLVIDDLGSERGRAKDHATAIVCARHDAGRPTLITTTLLLGSSEDDPGSFASWYPGSVHSRITLGFRAVGGHDLRTDDAEPDLGRVHEASRLARAADACRLATRVGCDEEAARAAIDRLAEILGVDEGAIDVAADEIRTRREQAIEHLAETLEVLKAKAIAEVDDRSRRIAIGGGHG